MVLQSSIKECITYNGMYNGTLITIYIAQQRSLSLTNFRAKEIWYSYCMKKIINLYELIAWRAQHYVIEHIHGVNVLGT